MSGYIPFVGHPRAVFFAAAVGHERCYLLAARALCVLMPRLRSEHSLRQKHPSGWSREPTSYLY